MVASFYLDDLTGFTEKHDRLIRNRLFVKAVINLHCYKKRKRRDELNPSFFLLLVNFREDFL